MATLRLTSNSEFYHPLASFVENISCISAESSLVRAAPIFIVCCSGRRQRIRTDRNNYSQFALYCIRYKTDAEHLGGKSQLSAFARSNYHCLKVNRQTTTDIAATSNISLNRFIFISLSSDPNCRNQ